MLYKFSNNYVTSISADLLSTDTVVSLQDVTGFPTVNFAEESVLLTLEDGFKSKIEIVKVTGRNLNDCTIVRGQEGTTAQDFVTGDKASNRITAETINTKLDTAGGTVNGNLTLADEKSLQIGDGTSYIYGYGDGVTASANWEFKIVSNANLDGWGDITLDSGGSSVTLTPGGDISAVGTFTVNGNTVWDSSNHGATSDPHPQYSPKVTGKNSLGTTSSVIDLSVSHYQKITVDAAKTLSITNEPTDFYMFLLDMEFTVSTTITWFGTIKWPNGTPPVFEIGTYVVGFTKDPDELFWQGFIAGRKLA